MYVKFYFFFIFLSFQQLCISQENRVNTLNGCVLGQKSKIFPDVTEFLGVPFAEPPVRSLRFKPPRPLSQEAFGKQCFNATKLAKTCFFQKTPIEFKGICDWEPKSLKMSEDCLQLNMWVPKEKTGAVIVFIAGQAYRTGSASLPFYDGSVLASKTGTIVVNVNYRLGALGFAYLAEAQTIPGNMGLMDQQLALKWIFDNIEYFGGDKDLITLFGHGAGASSVTAHMLSDNSRKYFSKVIASSGTINNRWAYEKNKYVIDSNFRKLSRKLHCYQRFDRSLVRCMQRKNVFTLVHKAGEVYNLEQSIVKYPFLPIDNDCHFFKSPIKEKLKKGNFKKKVDILIGKTSSEATLFMPQFLGKSKYGCNFNFKKSMKSRENQCLMSKTQYKNAVKLLGRDHKLDINGVFKILENYKHTSEQEFRDKVGRIIADFGFDCEYNDFAKKIAKYVNGNKYLFTFYRRSSYIPWPKWMGAVRGYELLYIFGHPFMKPSDYKKRYLKNEQRFSMQAMQIIAYFAAEGKLHDSWPQFTRHHLYAAAISKALKPDEKFKIQNLDTKECRNFNWIKNEYKNKYVSRYPSDYMQVRRKKLNNQKV